MIVVNKPKETTVKLARTRQALTATQAHGERVETVGRAAVMIIGGFIALVRGVASIIDEFNPPGSDEA